MANSFNFSRANANTPNENGWCQRWAEQGFGLNGLYPSAYAAYLAASTKRGGTPPNDGNYYVIYFDGWFYGHRYGDICLYRNGQVWSGSALQWRAQSRPTTLAAYKAWLKTPQLAWSEFIGSRRIATIPPPPKPAPKPPAASGRVAQKGTFIANNPVNIRRTPSTRNNAPVAVLLKNQTVRYDSYIDREGIRWVSYIGNSGKRNYVARRTLDNKVIYGRVI